MDLNENKGKKFYFVFFLVILIFLSIIFLYFFLNNYKKTNVLEDNKKTNISIKNANPKGAVFKAPQIQDRLTKEECAAKMDNSFLLPLALGNYDDICVGDDKKLERNCLRSQSFVGIDSSIKAGINEPPSPGEFCSYVCEIINRSYVDDIFFKNIVMEGNYIVDLKSKEFVYEKINASDYVLKYGSTFFTVPESWRVSIIYRIDKDRLEDLCSMYGDYDKNLCLKNLIGKKNFLTEFDKKCSI